MNRALKVIAALALMVVVSSSFVWKDAANNGKRPLTGTLNGHNWVDLGLPSGVLWATCNIGASDSLQKGDYFAWGEVEPKENYEWGTYKYGSGADKLTKYCTDPREGYKGFVDSLTVLQPCDDAATVNWGAGWRTPTVEDFEELINACKWEWQKTKGYLVIGPNGNSFFLPTTGFKCPTLLDSYVGKYWASNLKPNILYHGEFDCGLAFWRDDKPRIYYFYSRMYGLPVRPVCSAQ